MSELDIRQSAFEMLRDTLAAEDGAGSDLAVFRLEEGGEWAEVQGYIDMGHLVSEVVSWAREQPDREPSDAEVEAAARGAYDRAFLKHAPEDVDRWDDLVVDNDEAAESWREVARAALLAAQEVHRG